MPWRWIDGELWKDYSFVIYKLGFDRVSIMLPDGISHSWQSKHFDHRVNDCHQAVHEISNGTVIELAAGKEEMSEVRFSLLGDLAAEAWFKAAARFRGQKMAKAVDQPVGPVGEAIISFKTIEEKPAVGVTELVKP
jgi:hypothetical protein